MSLADLPTLGQEQQRRRAVPKDQLPTRLDVKTAADTDDAKLLRQVAQKVRLRDRAHCRVCKVQTLVTLELDPRRGECHHLVSRTCRAVRHDIRNCVHVCLKCHKLLTGHKLFPLGKGADATFKAGRTLKTYLNGGSVHLQFVSKRPEL